MGGEPQYSNRAPVFRRRFPRIKTYTKELVDSSPDLIVASSSPVIAVLKQATSTIPIVFSVVNDPLGQGFIASQARPGGNITGFTFVEIAMIGKWLELLKEVAPGVKRIRLLFNPQTAAYYPFFFREFGANATSLAARNLCHTGARRVPKRSGRCRPWHGSRVAV